MDGKKRSFLSNVLKGALALGIGAAVVAGVTATPSSVMAAEPTSDRDSGIIVNLHDYSVSENRNVNSGKTLKFGNNEQRGGVKDGDYRINAWTGSGNGVYQGIVKSYLTAGEDGELYPSLAGRNGQSLEYLFDLSGNDTSSVWNYRNLSGLLEKGSDGYWEYGSAKNFVSISRGQNGEYAFSRDEEPRARRANNTDIAADEPLFLPFNDVESRWSRAKDNNGNRMNYEERFINKAWNNNQKTWDSSSSANYSFGMDISANFYMPKGGMIDNQEMVFSFTGDDDVWVFIDDMLVLDLGGIHDARQGTINFATGEVWVDRVYNENKTNTDDKTISLRELFEAALRDQGYSGDEINKRLSEDFKENGTFKDYSSHTIKFYYLERGNGGSNCQIRFNLPTIPEGTLGFTKDVTYTNVNDTSDIDFLFNAYIDPDGDEGTENYALYDGPYVVVDADTNRFIELRETERIDINGDGRYSAEEQNVIVLKDGQRALITSENTYGQDAQASVEIDQLSKFYVKELGATSDKYEVSVNDTVIEAQTAGGENTIPGVQSPEFVVSEDPYITFGNKISAENRLTLKVEKSGAYDPNDTFYVRVMIGDKLYGSGDGTGAESGVYYVYNSDGTAAGSKIASNGVIELKGGQYAEIRYIAGGNSISVVEVADASGSSVFAGGEKYKDPSYSITGTSDSSGSALDPDSIKDVDASDPLQGITATTNEGKGLGQDPVVTVTVSNSLVAEPVQPELHKYVDDNEDGTYDLSLDVHGAIGASQADPTEVDIVYILDLSYSMMWEMDGTYPGGEYNDGGDDEEWAEEYSFVRYNAAVNAINTLNSELAANEGLDVRAALVTFAPETLKETGFVSASSFSSMLPAAQWSTFASGTNYGAALNSAKSVLEGAREDARKVVIFISDGEPNRDGLTANEKGDADESTQFAENQVRDLVCDSFYTIGVGRDTYEQYLKRVVNAAASAKYKQYFASSDSDALAEYFESIASAITAVDCTNVVITDKLSEFAELTDDATFNVTITKDDHGGESVAVTGGHVSIEDAEKGAELTFQSENGEIQTLTLKYDADTKTFTLTFPPNYALEAGWTYTITTQIQPTEDARNHYQQSGNPHTGDPETDVPGTPDSELISSGKPGFHSNDEATLSYTSAKQNKVDEYPNPVIQANQLTIKDVLKVTKTENGSQLNEDMFEFTIEPQASGEGDTAVTAQQAAEKAGLTLAGDVYAYSNEGSAGMGETGLARMGNEITFTTDDIGKTYIYEYAETGKLTDGFKQTSKLSESDFIFDEAHYQVELAVDQKDSKLQVTMTKSKWNADEEKWEQLGDSVTITSANCDCSQDKPLMTVDFENAYIQPKDVSYPVGIEKTLKGDQLDDDMFKFSVTAQKTDTVEANDAAIKAGSTTQEGEAVNPWAVTNSGDKFPIFNSMHFSAGDVGNVYEYVISEDASYNAGGKVDPNDYLYDDNQYLVQFKPVIATSVDGTKSLEVELWVAERSGSEENFPAPEKVGVFSRGEFTHVTSQAQGRALQDDPQYLLEFTNTVSKADLGITKKLEQGSMPGAPNNAQFKIQIELRDQDGELVNDTFDAVVGSETRKVEFEQGVATVPIKANETIVIKGVPVGATCKVTEPVDQIPDGFELAWIDESVADGKADARAANEYEWIGEIDPDGNDVTVTNRFVGYGLGIFKGELAYDENGDIALDDDDLPYADPEHPLSGAVFEISAKNEQDEKQAIGRLETDEDGKAVFMSLPDSEGKSYQTFLMPGTYYINEVKVPSGYQLLGYEITLTIGNDGKASISIPRGEDEDPLIKELNYDNDGNLLIEVANKPNPDLPSSGSNGTLLMMSTGFAAIVLAGTYLSKRFGHLWN